MGETELAERVMVRLAVRVRESDGEDGDECETGGKDNKKGTTRKEQHEPEEWRRAINVRVRVVSGGEACLEKDNANWSVAINTKATPNSTAGCYTRS